MMAVKQEVERSVVPATFCGLQSLSEMRIWVQKYAGHVAPKMRVVANRSRPLDGGSISSERVIGILRDELKLQAPILVICGKGAANIESLRAKGPDIFVSMGFDCVTDFCVMGKISPGATKEGYVLFR